MYKASTILPRLYWDRSKSLLPTKASSMCVRTFEPLCRFFVKLGNKVWRGLVTELSVADEAIWFILWFFKLSKLLLTFPPSPQASIQEWKFVILVFTWQGTWPCVRRSWNCVVRRNSILNQYQWRSKLSSWLHWKNNWICVVWTFLSSTLHESSILSQH